MVENPNGGSGGVFAKLSDRIGEEAPQPRLEPVRRVAELLGDPQRAYPVIHIAGTNGKTSTSRIIESIVRAYGLRTGLFTSPHLERFAERICIDGDPASEEFLDRNWEDIKPYVLMVDKELTDAGKERLTFFEVTTLLAFACFADAPVDIAVVEVGLGGEWDSTNIVVAQLSVFTPISLDHTDRLGETIAEIARTKSGVIKPAQPVVSASQLNPAVTELRRATELTESAILFEGHNFEVIETQNMDHGQRVTIRGTAGQYDDIFLSLRGEFQAHNAAVAVAAVETFFGSHAIPDGILEEALPRVVVPGRLQVFGADPVVIGDVAHNPAGAASLRDSLEPFVEASKFVVVFGVLDGKDLEGIAGALVPAVSRWHVTRPISSRARDPRDVAATISPITSSEIEIYEDVERALEEARSWAAEAPHRAVLVTGSVVIVGDALTVAAKNGWRI